MPDRGGEGKRKTGGSAAGQRKNGPAFSEEGNILTAITGTERAEESIERIDHSGRTYYSEGRGGTGYYKSGKG